MKAPYRHSPRSHGNPESITTDVPILEPRIGVYMLLIASAAYIALGVLVSCGAVKTEAATDLHKAQLLSCVDQAHSKAEARVCFDKVDARWGIAVDGGDQ